MVRDILFKSLTHKVYSKHEKEFLQWLTDNPECTQYQALHKATQLFNKHIFDALAV